MPPRLKPGVGIARRWNVLPALQDKYAVSRCHNGPAPGNVRRGALITEASISECDRLRNMPVRDGLRLVFEKGSRRGGDRTEEQAPDAGAEQQGLASDPSLVLLPEWTGIADLMLSS